MRIFRIDDIGASTKQFEQYSKIRGGNFWFLKRIWPFKSMGPYSELTASEWETFLNIFSENSIKPIISITASWVDKDSSLTPFPEKFPAESAVLKKALKEKREALSRALGWAEQDREAGNIFLYMIRAADARYFSKQLQKIIKRLEELGIDTKKLLKEKY